MEQTRYAAIRILQGRGTATAADLAQTLGVSTGSIRRHMDMMVAEGLLETTLVRQRRGRPVTRYSLSMTGEDEFSGANYAQMFDRIHWAFVNLDADEVSGRTGVEILNLLFDRVSESVAELHAPLVSAENLWERSQQVVAALQGEGILDLVDQRDGMIVMQNSVCPVRSYAEATQSVCAADLNIIELLVGVPVLQSSTVASGGAVCEYMVQMPTDVRQVVT